MANNYKNNEKKVWRFLSCIPDHEPGIYVCLQELEGDWGDPNFDGHDKEGWREADEPRSTRVVFMKRLDDGSLRNIHSGGGYNGNKYTQKDQ